MIYSIPSIFIGFVTVAQEHSPKSERISFLRATISSDSKSLSFIFVISQSLKITPGDEGIITILVDKRRASSILCVIKTTVRLSFFNCNIYTTLMMNTTIGYSILLIRLCFNEL